MHRAHEKIVKAVKNTCLVRNEYKVMLEIENKLSIYKIHERRQDLKKKSSRQDIRHYFTLDLRFSFS